jgi:hypothetical protein
MAIAVDATSQDHSATATSLTFSHTCSGSNRILFVGIVGDITTDTVTGVTYAGVSMTLVGKNKQHLNLKAMRIEIKSAEELAKIKSNPKYNIAVGDMIVPQSDREEGKQIEVTSRGITELRTSKNDPAKQYLVSMCTRDNGTKQAVLQSEFLPEGTIVELKSVATKERKAADGTIEQLSEDKWLWSYATIGVKEVAGRVN